MKERGASIRTFTTPGRRVNMNSRDTYRSLAQEVVGDLTCQQKR